MDELKTLRENINVIDDQLVSLFKKRMEIVLNVAEYKIKNSMEVLDSKREEEIIKKHLEKLNEDDFKNSTKQFLEGLMSISRSLQKDLIKESKKDDKENFNDVENKLKPLTVGFQGVEGSFSHEALIEFFKEDKITKNYLTFDDVLSAIKNDDIKYGVLPIENSSTGGVSEVYDLLREYGLYIVGEKCIRVNHNLISLKGTNIEDIEEVYSHPQAFMQSNRFLEEYNMWKLIPHYNTAKSAQYISSQNIKNKACIASKKAANLYDLKILKENINNNSNNYTRFIIVGKELLKNSKNNKISVVLTLPHRVGELNSILDNFTKNDLNMLKIESRPTQKESWQYFFYIDFEGNLNSTNVKNVIESLRNDSSWFQVLGNYEGENL